MAIDGNVSRSVAYFKAASTEEDRHSVFVAPESPFYLLYVIFSLLHFFGRRPKGGGHDQSGPMVNTPMITA